MQDKHEAVVVEGAVHGQGEEEGGPDHPTERPVSVSANSIFEARNPSS